MAMMKLLSALTAGAVVDLDLSNHETTLVIVHGIGAGETIPILIGTSAGFVAYRDATGAQYEFDGDTNVTMLNLPNGLFRFTKAITSSACGIDYIPGPFLRNV